ncbi:hypothetical protein PF008_g6022 [Phytophthora fragariae]|nr:hypothetical protein PF008_g6022 [Phytophthora fragariae]
MRNALVDFARVAAPLQARLQTALEGTKRTKHVAARVAIDFTAEERNSFGQVKQLLAKSATLVTPDDSDELILMTDASDAGWSIIMTAVEDWNPATSITEQQYQLVHCMSGTYTHVQVELRPLRPHSEWPTEEDIKCAQIATTCTRPPHLEEQPNGLWRDEQNRLWIP